MPVRVPFSEILGVLELHGWKLQRIASPYRNLHEGAGIADSYPGP